MPSISNEPEKTDAGFPGFDRENKPPWEQDTGDDYIKWKNTQPTVIGGLEVRGRIVVGFKAHQQHKRQLPVYYQPDSTGRPPTNHKILIKRANRGNPLGPQVTESIDSNPPVKDFDDEFQQYPINRNRQRTPDAQLGKKRTTATMNKPYPWHWIMKNPQRWKGRFTTDDGLQYSYAVGMYESWSVLKLSDRVRKWDITFGFVPEGRPAGAKYGVEGTGDQFRVFATIMGMTVEFLKKVKPKIVTFSADEPSRRRLYTTLIKREAEKLGYTFVGHRSETNEGEFELHRERSVRKVAAAVNQSSILKQYKSDLIRINKIYNATDTPQEMTKVRKMWDVFQNRIQKWIYDDLLDRRMIGQDKETYAHKHLREVAWATIMDKSSVSGLFPETYTMEEKGVWHHDFEKFQRDKKTNFNRHRRAWGETFKAIEEYIAHDGDKQTEFGKDETLSKAGMKIILHKEGLPHSDKEMPDAFLRTHLPRAIKALTSAGFAKVMRGIDVNVYYIPNPQQPKGMIGATYNYGKDSIDVFSWGMTSHTSLVHEFGHRLYYHTPKRVRDMWDDNIHKGKIQVEREHADEFDRDFIETDTYDKTRSTLKTLTPRLQSIKDPIKQAVFKSWIQRYGASQWIRKFIGEEVGAWIDGEFSTNYGATNPQEAFAETFMLFVVKGFNRLGPQTKYLFKRVIEYGGYHLRASVTADWWEEKSPEQQTEYITEHPASHKAKDARDEPIADEPIADEPKRPKTSAQKKKQRLKNQAAKQRWQALMVTKSPKDQMAYEHARKRKLPIPPGWINVWINDNKRADLQATGRDVKNRITYLYSEKHKKKASVEKFKRIQKFAKFLPRLEQRIQRDMRKSTEAKVLYLISKTGFRVGGDHDRKAEVEAFGASTLRSEHVRVEGDTVHFNFIGKKGVQQSHSIQDPVVAQMFSHPGSDGKFFETDENHIMRYLRSISGKKKFQIKDFRTHKATSMALKLVDEMPAPTNAKEYKAAVLAVATQVSQRLGNTPKMAHDSYIAPDVYQSWKAVA